MLKEKKLSLKIPNDRNVIPIALNFVKSIAQILGFTTKQLIEIEIAVEESIVNVIEHAFSPDELCYFDIHCEAMATALKISVADQGLPFDPRLLPEYKIGEDLDNSSALGLGSYLIKSLMDEVEYLNLGAEGKVLNLIKYFPSLFVETSNSIQLETDLTEKIPKDHRIEVEVRQMLAKEAIEVSRCFFDAYGYSYVHEHVYYPERLAALNESGELFSAVAVTKDGEVASHAALIFSQFHPGVAELAMGATKGKYRGHSATGKLDKILTIEAYN